MITSKWHQRSEQLICTKYPCFDSSCDRLHLQACSGCNDTIDEEGAIVINRRDYCVRCAEEILGGDEL